MTVTITLQNKLGTVTVDEPVMADDLQVFPLSWESETNLDYVTLDEGMSAGTLEITEIDEGGSVPTLLVVNNSDAIVFLMAGEHLIGSKQDRVLNASLMIPARSKLPIPVSCVEAGRWGYRSRKSYGSGNSSHARLRMLTARAAHEGYRRQRSPTSNQDAVWREVSRKLESLGSHSPSSALGQAYEDYHTRLEKMVQSVQVPENASGVAFAFSGRITGVDLFDKPATLSKLLPKLVKAYALDALVETDSAKLDCAAVQEWLRSAGSTTFERYESPGLGDDIRLEGQALVGAALIVNEGPVHVELFPDDEQTRLVPRPQPEQVTPSPTSRAISGDIAIFPTSPEMLELTAEAIPALRGQHRVSLAVTLQLVNHEQQHKLDATQVLSRAEEARLVSLAQGHVPAAKLRMILTRHRLENNLFVRWHEDTRTTIVSLYDWERLSPLPAAAFVAQTLVMQSLYAAGSCDPRQLLHEESRGCLFDLCLQKQDINLKLRSGSICPTCRQRLADAGVDVVTLRCALGFVQRLASSGQ